MPSKTVPTDTKTFVFFESDNYCPFNMIRVLWHISLCDDNLNLFYIFRSDYFNLYHLVLINCTRFQQKAITFFECNDMFKEGTVRGKYVFCVAQRL